jgi:hypothetical protein
VFSMWSAPSNSRNWALGDQLLGYATVFTVEYVSSVGSMPRLYTEIPRITEAVESQLTAGHSHGKFVVEEELEVSLRRFSVCHFMCDNYSNFESVIINCSYV